MLFHRTQCRWCGKHVAEKPIIGTLHFCLLPEERATVDRMRWQVKEQKRMIARGNPYLTAFPSLKDPI